MNNLSWDYLYKRWNYLKSHKSFQDNPIRAIFRTIWWYFHCLFGIPATIKLYKWDCLFFLPPKFRRAGSTGVFVTRENYEPELTYLEYLLSPGNIFIDGGANFGIYTVVAAKLVGDSGRVLSFEPGVDSHSILTKNVGINEFGNTKVFQKGLSDKEGKARFYHIDNAPNSYSLGGDDKENTTFEEIDLTTIEHTLNQENINRLDLIKLDVEGAEELVLRGSKSIIEKLRPKIIFEVSEPATLRLGLERDGAGKLLKELGYRFFVVKQDGTLMNLDFPKKGNNVAIPEEQCINLENKLCFSN